MKIGSHDVTTASRETLRKFFLRKKSIPYLYGTVKTHKSPYGSRYISGGMDVALNVVSDWVHVMLSGIMQDVHSLARSALAGMWQADPPATCLLMHCVPMNVHPA